MLDIIENEIGYTFPQAYIKDITKLANAILDNIEKAGMMPPQYFNKECGDMLYITEKDYLAYRCRTYGWEPEDAK